MQSGAIGMPLHPPGFHGVRLPQRRACLSAHAILDCTTCRGKGAADLKKRAVLISGPPGIGKTTAALCLCRELGLRAVEVNASDTRSKADASALKGVGGKLANAIKELTTNAAVSYSTTGTRDKVRGRFWGRVGVVEAKQGGSLRPHSFREIMLCASLGGRDKPAACHSSMPLRTSACMRLHAAPDQSPPKLPATCVAVPDHG